MGAASDRPDDNTGHDRLKFRGQVARATTTIDGWNVALCETSSASRRKDTCTLRVTATCGYGSEASGIVFAVSWTEFDEVGNWLEDGD